MKRAWRTGVMLICLAAAACGDDDKAVQDAVKGTSGKTALAKAADQAVQTNMAPPFVYSPVGRRDPFRSYLADLAEQQVAEAPSRKREETELYEIDQYRLTGLITGTAQPKAMVEDPTGRGHVLHIGSRMGKNDGRVTKITPVGIVVVEETRDPTGKKVRLPIVINLPKSEFDDVVQR